MATPPPEAASVLKEEKPQLPPSPNGAPAEEPGHAGVQDSTTDAKANASTNGDDGSKPAANGATTDLPPITNGLNATASPPKSPSMPSAESAAPPAPPVDNTKPDPPADEMRMVGDEQPPQSNAEPTDNNVAESKAPETSAPESVPTENAAQLAAPENVTATADNKAPEGVTTETKSSADAATENKAPEKAATNAVPEGEAPSTSAPENATPADTQPQDAPKPLSTDSPQDTKMENVPTPQESFPVTSEIRQPLTQPNATEAPSNDVVGAAPPIPTQPLDQEMPDAPQGPMSPTKMSREREPDQSEEPAAKRPKVEGEEPGPADVKVPELPTPTTEPPAESPMDKKPGMTKMQHKFLVKGIQSLKRMQHARFYREPVDPIKLNIPQYHQVITQPMDLGTIEKKLKNNEYPTPQGYIDDFNLMVQNSVTFNGPDHIVAQEALSLKSTFDKQMLKLPGPDEVEEKKPKKAPQKTSAARREPRTSAGQASRPAGGSPQATTFALSPEGLPLIRRDSTNTDGRPKRSIHPPKRDLPYSTKPKKKKYQWELRFCQETLDELHKSKHYSYAVPFYLPVDPVALNIPSYHSIVKNPMDLSTISSKLKAGQYEHAKEFEADMRLMLKNCFRFNIQGDPTYMAGQRLEEVFNNKWAGLKRYLEMHEPHPGHMSATSDEDGSEEDDDESDEYDESQAVNSLQKQMLDISRQLEAMTQKKKKTPPGSKKVGKSKSGKKDSKDSKKSRSSGTGKKDRKSKSSKAEKDRWVTYHEKQIISNGISSLPDKKMQEALKIIQSNVPSLKGTQETEIELDIDELPNEVLLMLLKFVKKNAPQVMEDDDVEAPAMNTSAPKPKKNKPMSKFEQEAQINMLESNLSRFQSGHSPDAMPSVEANESSDDSDDVSEESEEE